MRVSEAGGWSKRRGGWVGEDEREKETEKEGGRRKRDEVAAEKEERR